MQSNATASTFSGIEILNIRILAKYSLSIPRNEYVARNLMFSFQEMVASSNYPTPDMNDSNREFIKYSFVRFPIPNARRHGMKRAAMHAHARVDHFGRGDPDSMPQREGRQLVDIVSVISRL